MFVSSDGGKTWIAAKGIPAFGSSGVTIQTFAVDPTSGDAWAGGNSAIFESTDKGLEWTEFAAGKDGLPATFFVDGMAIDPSNPSTVYAVTSGNGVYKTTDGGTSWTAVNTGLTNLNVTCIAEDPANPNDLYVGTAGSGVFASINGGSSWTQLSTTGLPSTRITSIVGGPIFIGTASGVAYYAGGKFHDLKIVYEGKPVTVYDASITYKEDTYIGSVGVKHALIIHTDSPPQYFIYWGDSDSTAYAIPDNSNLETAVADAFAGDPLWLAGRSAMTFTPSHQVCRFCLPRLRARPQPVPLRPHRRPDRSRTPRAASVRRPRQAMAR